MLISGTIEPFDDGEGHVGTVYRIPILDHLSSTDHPASPEEICELVKDYCEAFIEARLETKVTVDVRPTSDSTFVIDCSSCIKEMLALIIFAQRLNEGISQRALARREGTNHSGITFYEGAQRSPSVEKLDSLLAALGYDLEIVLHKRAA